MSAAAKPRKVILRTYNVGFGDCFLMTFSYATKERHILIDFGSTSKPKKSPEKLMVNIAEDIKEKCGGKLSAVIATHRHRDHISGFRMTKNDTGSGATIRSCEPEVVIQPWTEHPKAPADAVKPPGVLSPGGAPMHGSLGATMTSMQTFMQYAVNLAEEHKGGRRSPGSLAVEESITDQWREIEAVGTTNLKNLSALKNLATMSKSGKYYYVHAGSDSGLKEILPGVKTHILGPPTVEQSGGATLTQRRTHPDEFWKLQAHAARVTGKSGYSLFERRGCICRKDPVDIRWFKENVRSCHRDQLLQFVRSVDKAINNTSIIMVFECGEKKFLFSGDAQYENWAYAMNRDEYKELLRDVSFYKVGHHGSKNATPISLWNMFENRKSKTGSKKTFTSVNSTLSDFHHDVPVGTLVEDLKKEGAYLTTEEFGEEQRSRVLTFDL